MNRPRLLLLTAHFPYDKGEEFLETEINYLAQHFAITIAPLSQDFDRDSLRPVPDGVMVLPGIAARTPAGIAEAIRWLGRQPERAFRIGKSLLKACVRLRCRPILLKELLRFVTYGMRLADVLAEAFSSSPMDIVYSYWLSTGAMAGALLKKEGVARIAISRAHRGDLYHEHSALGFLPGQDLSIQALDKVFCISQHGVDYLRTRYPGTEYKFELSRLGVRSALARNEPAQDGRLHLVSCAYLTPVKRIGLLIDALGKCEITVTWTHLGGGNLEEQLKEQARQLPPNIQWRISGQLSNQQVLRFYQENRVDLFVNVSASEGLPVSIMEAMSFGIPVAATDAGGSKELVHDGENGILWPVDVSSDVIASDLTTFFALSAKHKNTMREAAWQAWRDSVNAEVQYPDFARRLLSFIQL